MFTSFNPKYGLDLGRRAGPHSTMESSHLRPSFELDYLRSINKSLSLSLSAANKLNYNTNDTTIIGVNQIQGFQSSSSSQLGTQLVAVRSGRIGLDWKISEKDILNASVTYRGRDADQGTTGVGVTYGAGATGSPTFTQGAATGVGSVSQSFSWQNLLSHTTHALLKYKHLGDTWKIDASASYSYSSFYFEPTFETGYFGTGSISIPNLVVRGEGLDGTATRAADLAADTYTIRDRLGALVSLYDGRLYSVNTGGTFDSGNVVDKTQARLDLRRDPLSAARIRKPITAVSFRASTRATT